MSEPRVNIDRAKIFEKTQAASIEALNVSLISSGRLLRAKLSHPGKGRIYRVAKGGKTGARNLRAAGFHRASAPGDPPAVNTNRLRASWSVARLGVSLDSFAVISASKRATILTFGSNVPYAQILEVGGTTGRGRRSRIASRPYIKPTMPAIAKLVPQVFDMAFRKAFK